MKPWFTFMLLSCMATSATLAEVGAAEPRAQANRGGIVRGEVEIPPVPQTFPFSGRTYGTLWLSPGGGIALRYQLWALMGEPVWTFVARSPVISHFTLSRDEGREFFITIQRLSSLPPETVRWHGQDHKVWVSDDIMDRARVYDFAFNALMSPFAIAPLPRELRNDDIPQARRSYHPVTIHRRYPGLLIGQGEWGWDVPGSPNWDRVFTYHSQTATIGGHRLLYWDNYRDERFDTLLYDEDDNKEIFRRIRYHYQNEGVEPVQLATVGNFRVSVSPVISAIMAAEPEALRNLYQRRHERDDQVYNLMSAYHRFAQSGQPAAAVAQRAALISRVVSEIPDLPPELVSLWTAQEGGKGHPDGEQQLQQLAALVTPQLNARTPSVTPQLDEAHQQSTDYFDRLGEEGDLPAKLQESWQRLDHTVAVLRREAPQPCGQETQSGGPGLTRTRHALGLKAGTVRVAYDMYGAPDQMDIWYNGSMVASTQRAVSGKGELTFAYDPQDHLPAYCEIEVRAPGSGTRWEYTLFCPE